jgi:hypothetical protein
MRYIFSAPLAAKVVRWIHLPHRPEQVLRDLENLAQGHHRINKTR